MTTHTYADPRELDSVAERARELADRAGLPDLATRVRAASPRAVPGPPRVVIAGEEKRGKSSLINALIGRPLLSPVGDDVVTATYVLFLPGDRDRAVAIVMDPASGQPSRVEIGLDELDDYVSVDAIHEGVVGAEVHLTTPLLRTMEFVDTPGVGGLTSGHSAVTMSTLDTAHAFLFVMDAGAPLSQPELTFLGEVVQHNDAVVLVMTKTDLYPEWQAVREDNRRLIAHHVPALAGAPIVPLSSRLAEHAGRLDDADSAVGTRLRHLSGIEELMHALETTMAARSALLSHSGRLRILNAVLTELRARLTERPEVLSADPAGMSNLIAERDRLSAFLSDPHFGALYVNRRMDRLRRDAERDFALRAGSVVQRWNAAIDSYPARELNQIPTLLKGELAHLVADSVDAVDRELSDILDGLEVRIGSTAVMTTLRRTLSEQSQPELSDHQAVEDWAGHLLAVSAQAVTTTSAVAFGGFFLAGPIGVAIGVAAIATLGLRELLGSRLSGKQESLRAWLPRVETEAGRAFERDVSARLDDLERILNSELPRLLQDRVSRIERLTASGPPEPRAATSATATKLSDVDALIERVDALLASTPRA
jgi:GTP-binding protein EngB required for normal cell division